MAYNIFIFILFYSIAVVPCIGMYNKALFLLVAFSNNDSRREYDLYPSWSNLLSI